MDSARQMLVKLIDRYAFADVCALLDDAGLPPATHGRIRGLCLFGERLLELDAEDFDMRDLAEGETVPGELIMRAMRCRMPQEPDEPDRGALRSLRPAYRLLMEVLDARWRRADMAGLVACAHIVTEYLPLLIWESVWGHAADPARLAGDVVTSGSHFGDREAQDARVCDHNRTDAGATMRALKVASGPGEGWRAYLDRQHSNVSHALAVCAARCKQMCGVMLRHDEEVRESLAVRCSIALAFGDCSLIRLRHAAPVGHGFGVPSREEVLLTWERSREALAKRGPIGETVLTEDGFCLPGLPSLVSALADVPLGPDTLMRDVAELAAGQLTRV